MILRPYYLKALICSLILSFSSSLFAEPAIAVVDFTSAIRNSYYKEKLPDLIVDRLVNAGYSVVERDKFKSMMTELELGQSGMIDQTTASSIGKMSGAQFLVTGKILAYSKNQKTSTLYETKITKYSQRLQARMEMVDLQSGIKIFSKTAEQVSTHSASGMAETNTATDVGNGVARKLVNAMLASKSVKKAIKGNSGQADKIKITIHSEPEFADIEVDGIYYGQAGQPLELTAGKHSIKVSIPGYSTWEKQVMVKEGMQFTARLIKDMKP